MLSCIFKDVIFVNCYFIDMEVHIIIVHNRLKLLAGLPVVRITYVFLNKDHVLLQCLIQVWKRNIID